MSIADDVKKILSGTTDEKITVIERLTRERLASLLKAEEVPSKLEYIVSDITLKRFNRIGNEGMSSYSQEGLSMSFPDSDFKEYADEIAEERGKPNTGKGNRSAAMFR